MRVLGFDLETASLVGLLFGDYAVFFLLAPALATAAITIAYSYYLYERLEPESNHETGA